MLRDLGRGDLLVFKMEWLLSCFTDCAGLEGHVEELLGSEVKRIKRWHAGSRDNLWPCRNQRKYPEKQGDEEVSGSHIAVKPIKSILTLTSQNKKRISRIDAVINYVKLSWHSPVMLLVYIVLSSVCVIRKMGIDCPNLRRMWSSGSWWEGQYLLCNGSLTSKIWRVNRHLFW